MTEQDLFAAIARLADLADVQAFLAEADVTPELRLRAEQHWIKHQTAPPPEEAHREQSVVDSNSVQSFQNTIPYNPQVGAGNQKESKPRSIPRDDANDAASDERQRDAQIASAGQAPGSDEPATFGRYETRRVLGSGSFGKVHLGFDPQLNRQVAIKVPLLKAGDSKARAQFLLEARQLAALKHPGVVSVYDISVEDNQCYIVSDYLEGDNLGNWLNRHPVEWPEIAEIVIKIADALAHAHANRIVHRDLKPANIIMTAGRNPVLVDFGLAISDSSATFHDRGVIVGTPSYMSPEQTRGEGHRIDGRTDIYALGVVMYRMLTGRLPFTAQRIEELLLQIQNDEPQPLRQLNPLIPRDLEKICLNAMEKRLRHRYSTAADMADDLRKLMGKPMPTAGTREPYPSPSECQQSNPSDPVMAETVLKHPNTLTQSGDTARPLTRSVPTDNPSGGNPGQSDSAPGPGHRSSPVRRSGSTVRRIREAERRRVTVVKFSCDVFTSADIIETLDSEDQEELLHQFQQLCRKVTVECGGTVAQLTEDGVRACFGYPIAFEDATSRAVRAGLKMIESMTALRERIRRKHKVELLAIAAIHSDHAVVQDAGEEGSLSIVGSLLNIVGQMDTVAKPNTVVVSGETFQSVQRRFVCESLGEQRFKGGQQEVYQVLSERAVGSQVDLSEPGALTPLIGRNREVGLLQERWEQAVEGMGQVVLLIGDAGLGKSRLVHTLKEHVLPGCTHASHQSSVDLRVPEAGATIVEWRCAAQHHSSSFYPPVEYFQRTLWFDRNESTNERLDKLVNHLKRLNLDGDAEIALLASMLSIPLEGRFPPLNLNPQLQKEQTFELLWDWMREQAAQRPVLFVLEDLHWLDPTTLEFIEQIVAKGLNDRILILLTFRPEFVTPWKSLAHQTQVALNRLTRRQIGEMMIAKIGDNVPQRVIDQIAERTDGVPLFVEEFTRTIIESNALSQAQDAGSSDCFRTHEIPATLQDLLIARLDRMTINLEVAQLASAIGREVSYEVMRAVSVLSEYDLNIELKKLVSADLMTEQGRPPRTKYTFKHALIQDAAYSSLVRKKRQQFHRRIGEVLESQFADTFESSPEILALHFTEAGDAAKAIDYWDKAGTRSVERRAFKEAIQQLRSGLELLREQPESPERFRREIKLHTALGVPLQATIGYGVPEVEANYARARELCGKLGLSTELFPVIYGLFRYYLLQAKHAQAKELAGQLVTLSNESPTPGFLVASNRAMGSPLIYEGKLHQAIPYLEKVASITPTPELRAQVYRYDVVDPWIVARSYMSWAFWLLGRPNVARTHSDEAVQIAEKLDHSFSLVLALSFSQWFHQFNRDARRTRESAEKALSLSLEHGYAPLYGWCRIMRGWAMSQQSEHSQGIMEIEKGLVEWRAQGSELGNHYYYALLAEACLTAGRLDKASTTLEQAEKFAANTGEGFWMPEIIRLRGELLLRATPADTTAAEIKFREALSVAGQQESRSLQLRTAFSLAQLLNSQDRTAEAREVLEPVCNSFADDVQSAELDAARHFLSSRAS